MHHQIYSGDRITYGNFTPSPITFGEGEGVKGYFDAYPFRLHQIYSGDRRSPLAPVPRTPKGYRGTCVLSSISVPRRGIGEGVRGTGDYLRFYESKPPSTDTLFGSPSATVAQSGSAFIATTSDTAVATAFQPIMPSGAYERSKWPPSTRASVVTTWTRPGATV